MGLSVGVVERGVKGNEDRSEQVEGGWGRGEDERRGFNQFKCNRGDDLSLNQDRPDAQAPDSTQVGPLVNQLEDSAGGTQVSHCCWTNVGLF